MDNYIWYSIEIVLYFIELFKDHFTFAQSKFLIEVMERGYEFTSQNIIHVQK